MVFDSLDSTSLSSVFQSTTNLIAEETTYSKASYYTTLGLYLISFPGLLSLVSRSVKAKNVQKVYEVPGPAAEGEPSMKQLAAEIVAYFNAQNYQIAEASDVIRFKGVAGRSTSQAFFLSFCTAIGLASLALVLQIQFQDFGGNFFYMCLLAPYAGVYYWKNGEREETANVKLEISEDEKTVDVTVEAGKEELERFAQMMKYQEKGMIRVKGIFENE